MKPMLSLFKFIILLLLVNIIGWFLVDGLLFLEFLIKPYTNFGKNVLYWIEHLGFLTALTILTINIMQGDDNK